jgi:hypothetical protein
MWMTDSCAKVRKVQKCKAGSEQDGTVVAFDNRLLSLGILIGPASL